MGFYVLVQPEGDATVALVEPVTGHPSLLMSCGGSQIAVQVAGRRDGAELAAIFGRSLTSAAMEFADRCDELTGGSFGCK